MSAESERERKISAAIIDAYLAEHDPYVIDHTVQVTSFGGAGTTALCQHLLSLHVDLQKGPGQWPFKHQRTPPPADEVPTGFRVVYLLGDPRNTVLSIFRREYQTGHYLGLHGCEPGVSAARRLASLEAFLEAGVDDFALADHFERWRAHDLGYPVLFLRYELLSGAWAELADFVGIPRQRAAFSIRPRDSDWRSQPTHIRDGLNRLYGDLAAEIEELPRAGVT